MPFIGFISPKSETYALCMYVIYEKSPALSICHSHFRQLTSKKVFDNTCTCSNPTALNLAD